MKVLGSDEIVQCWHLDIAKVLADLLSVKEFERYYEYQTHVANSEQGYTEMYTGDWWREMQRVVRVRKLLAIILYTDGIAVDFFGHTTLIPVMLTLGNFPYSLQRKVTGKRLIGFIPYLNTGMIRRCSDIHPSVVRRSMMHDALNMYVRTNAYPSSKLIYEQFC